ncbi:MAG TPA: PQQ-binding-like beta-propeller repeat protein [Phycisphaerae bacterium]|nr:PQQ-binding-like beta-propeller repeat protein [Phycisphaerae bacterium]
MQKLRTGQRLSGGKQRFFGVLAGAVLAAAGLGLHAQDVATTSPNVDTERGEPAAPSPARPVVAGGAVGQPGGLMDRAVGNEAQVFVDDSFASIEKLRAATRYASQGQSQLAITSYQKIINDYGQKLVYLNTDSYGSITDYVREKLLAMPAVQAGGGGMYEQLLGLEAEKEIGPAVAQRDMAGVIRACDRYFPSKAAFEGLSRAAEWYFERGDFAAAARIWQELLTHPSAAAGNGGGGDVRAQLIFKAAVAERMEQNETGARGLRDELQKEFPDAHGVVDGQDVKLVAKLDEVMGLPAWNPSQALPQDEWPEFQGGPTRGILPAANASVGAQLWTMELKGEGSGARAPAAMPVPMPRGMVMGQTHAMPQLASYPVLSQGTLLLHTGDRVIAVSSNAGSFQWAYPQLERSPAEVVRERVYQGQMEEGGNPFRPAAHYSAAVTGDRVYAVLPSPTGGGAENEQEADQNPLMPGTRLVCLDRTTGSVKWSTSARSIKLDAKGMLMFIGSPLVTKQGVFVMARKQGESAFVQLYLVRLDGESGEPTWTCYLCSASAGAYFGPMASFSGIPIPTFADDMVYVSTGQGADCAVDANAGRIEWLQVTDASKKSKTPQEMYVPREFAPSWKYNPPLVHRDELVTCENPGQEGELHVYNRWTGKPIRTVTAKDLGMTSLDTMVGLMGPRLILTGYANAQAVVVALNMETAEKSDLPASPEWTVPLPTDAGQQQGRPFLTTTLLYVPFEKGMALVDPAAGKNQDFWQWPRTERDTPGRPGNFLVTSEQVVVVNATEASGYSRWETARDNRLEQIKQHPGDPEPYLALAEISFRTNHLDLAEENMRKSVEQAVGAHDDGKDILVRLYRTNLNFAEQLLAKEDAGLRDRSRFYYEQCKATARTPEQQAEWRLSMSDLSLAQKKPEEAAMLYNQVLTDAALRQAPFRRGDTIARAGVTAELRFHGLIEKNGEDLYRPYEEQAAAFLAKGKSQQDLGALMNVVEAYPNSHAALEAATSLASAFREKQDWASALRVLQWLYPRASQGSKGEVTAELAGAYKGLKRYGAAVAWAERGLRQYPKLSWKEPGTNGETTFAGLSEQLKSAGQRMAEGRRPMMPAGRSRVEGPPIDPESVRKVFLANASLLTPVEKQQSMNRPDLVFAYRMRRVRIFEAATGKELTKDGGLQMPENGPAVLLGSSGNMSVVVQAHTLVGIDTKSQSIAWEVPLNGTGQEPPAMNVAAGQVRFIQRAGGGQIIIQGGGRLMIAGNVVSASDPDVDPFFAASMGDTEMARQMSFSRLGQSAFATMRMMDDKVVVVSSGAMQAYSVDTGKPAWQDPAGGALSVKLPQGFTSALNGNEDLLVAQVDAQDHAGSTFYVVDAETGKFRKQIKLESERAAWREVSEDGVLYAVTGQAVMAYDLFSDQDQPLWRDAIQSRFPTATVLTLDGLIMINQNMEVLCLSRDGGETLWPKPPQVGLRLDPPQEGGQIAYERGILDGDVAIFQSNGIFSGYHTEARPEDKQLAFHSELLSDTPALQELQVSDRYLICLAYGPTANAQRATCVLFFDRNQDALNVELVDLTSDATAQGEGQVLRAWQVVDNGIAMEINGNVRLLRAQQAK